MSRNKKNSNQQPKLTPKAIRERRRTTTTKKTPKMAEGKKS